jgi:hypothetical protein
MLWTSGGCRLTNTVREYKKSTQDRPQRRRCDSCSATASLSRADSRSILRSVGDLANGSIAVNDIRLDVRLWWLPRRAVITSFLYSTMYVYSAALFGSRVCKEIRSLSCSRVCYSLESRPRQQSRRALDARDLSPVGTSAYECRSIGIQRGNDQVT